MSWETRKDLTNQEATIRGRTIKFRLLTAPELADVATKFRADDNGDQIANFRDIAPIISPAIVEIEGFPGKDFRKFLTRDLQDVAVLIEIIKAVLNASALSEDEAKNSVSSPGTLSGESARSDAATIPQGDNGSCVSTTPIPSYTGTNEGGA